MIPYSGISNTNIWLNWQLRISIVYDIAKRGLEFEVFIIRFVTWCIAGESSWAVPACGSPTELVCELLSQSL